MVRAGEDAFLIKRRAGAGHCDFSRGTTVFVSFDPQSTSAPARRTQFPLGSRSRANFSLG